ncbi:MAG: hypothetical protein M1829_002647 [Trizodia sp. TS-e1964]|nr:MAG: hypothetical protein M1829_002647 [Trizodia sp. TS-e1964]
MHSKYLVFFTALLSRSTLTSASPADAPKRALHLDNGPKLDNIKFCAGTLNVVWADPKKAAAQPIVGRIDTNGNVNSNLPPGSFYLRPLRIAPEGKYPPSSVRVAFLNKICIVLYGTLNLIVVLEVWNIDSRNSPQPRCGLSYYDVLSCRNFKNSVSLMFGASANGKYLTSYRGIETWTIIESQGRQQLKIDESGEYKLTCGRQLQRDTLRLERNYDVHDVFFEIDP